MPDPEVVAQLEMTQEEVDSLHHQVSVLKAELTATKQDQTRLKSEVADAVWDLNKAEAANKEQVRGQGLGGHRVKG